MSIRIIYRHIPALEFKVGTIGEPGSRQFFLQFSSASGTNTIAIEKTQLMALIERFSELIRELKRNKLANDGELYAPAINVSGKLEFPIEEDFRAGVMGITWDPDRQNVSLEIQELSDQEQFSDLIQIDVDTSDVDFPPDLLQAILTLPQIRGFVILAKQVIAAGRAPCPFCGLPIDPSGHLCPRANGYKR